MNTDQQPIERAFLALWQFCTVEMGWEFFRAEFALGDPTQHERNAKKIGDYLRSLKDCPTVAAALKNLPPQAQ